jgi:hypothetical protein
MVVKRGCISFGTHVQFFLRTPFLFVCVSVVTISRLVNFLDRNQF